MATGKMDRTNYGTRAYTAQLSSGGIYALVLNPEGLPAARLDIAEYDSPDAALLAAEEKARDFNRRFLRGDC